MTKLFTLLFILLSINVIGQDRCSLEGRIIDDKGKPVPFCSIYIPELKSGSMANINGEFSITAPCEEYEIMFQSLGFQAKSVTKILQNETNELEIVMKAVAYALDEVNIDPNSEDPAYNVIRQATVMAPYYKKLVEAYKCKLYTRSFFLVEDIPWILKKMTDEEDIDELTTGNITETVSLYSFKRPNLVTETILAKKTGDNDTSKSSSSYINLNFYNLGGPEMINPLSRNAFQVYLFEYQNTQFENNQKIHKIKVIPRRKGNDLMKGYLYINDKIWNINKVDMEINQPLTNIKYIQSYQEVEENTWMPIHHQIKVKLSALGSSMNIQYLATLSDLEVEVNPKINQQVKEKISIRAKENTASAEVTLDTNILSKTKTEQKIESLLRKEKLKNSDAIKLVRLIEKQEREDKKQNKSDTTNSLNLSGGKQIITYADSAFTLNDSILNVERNVPLAEEEQNIYVKRDSITKVKNGDTTINKKRSPIGKILFFEGRLKTKNKKLQLRPKGLLAGVGGYFNTVDGYLINKELFSVGWRNYEGEYHYFTPTLEYAFERETFLANAVFSGQYNGEKRAGYSVKLGRSTSDFANSNAIGDISNSITSLFFEQNFKKLYQKDFIEIEHHFDVRDGLKFSSGFEYADRTTLTNNTDYSFANLFGDRYTPNIPQNTEVALNPTLVAANIASIVNAQLEYTPNHYFRIEQGEKRMLHSKSPTFTLNYKHGIPDFLESDVQFSLLSFQISQSRAVGIINDISYTLKAAKFLNNNSVPFADFENINTNPAYFTTGESDEGFHLLNPYLFNSNDYYFQGHLALEDNFILLKRLPYLNGKIWTEQLSVNYLRTEREINYTEIGYSLNRILLGGSIGVYAAFEEDAFQSVGFRAGFSFE